MRLDASRKPSYLSGEYANSARLASRRYTMLKRGEIRERLGIEGSSLSDCCTTFWCNCCALIPQDNEVKARLVPAAAPVNTGSPQTPGMQLPGAPPPAQV